MAFRDILTYPTLPAFKSVHVPKINLTQRNGATH
jgi:hypothetical protein